MTHLACYAYGVGHADEGVCLRLEIGNYRLLLDCGLKNLDSLTSDGASIDAVIATHAHVDHTYGLLSLHEAWPQVPIYASGVTAYLMSLNWPQREIPAPFCRAVPWRTPVEILDRLTLELVPAGHLPGAAALLISYCEPLTNRMVRVAYSGDFYLSNTRLATGLRLEELRGMMPDALIVSGTYGTSRHPHRRQQENRLMERLDQALTEGKSILLPVPTIGLGQELLFLLRSHYLFSGRDLAIWVHGWVAAGCDAYLSLIPHLPIAVQNFTQTQALFWDEQVLPHVYRGSDDGRDWAQTNRPKIVITDSHADFSQVCDHGEWLVLLPEATVSTVNSALPAVDQAIASQAIVTAETYWLSEHSDGNTTLQLIHSLRPQHVLFVHGHPEVLADFANLDELSNRYKLHLPDGGSMVELPIVEPTMATQALSDPGLPETRLAGEVAETAAEILISLPNEITMDARWNKFADTGVIEAYWQDEQLVIRGLSPQELTGSNANTTQLYRNCFRCQFYQNQRCTNQSSPLFQLQVTPDGYCLEFVSVEED